VGRAMLPFGLVYLTFAVLYFGYLVMSGDLSPTHVISAVMAAVTSVLLIAQGRTYRHDPRFR